MFFRFYSYSFPCIVLINSSTACNQENHRKDKNYIFHLFISLLTSLLYIFCNFHAKYFQAKSENFCCFIVIYRGQLSKKEDSLQFYFKVPTGNKKWCQAPIILVLNFPFQSLQVQSFCSLIFFSAARIFSGVMGRSRILIPTAL